jgi:hypothetical protein
LLGLVEAFFAFGRATDLFLVAFFTAGFFFAVTFLATTFLALAFALVAIGNSPVKY